jgi:hypothetical protein
MGTTDATRTADYTELTSAMRTVHWRAASLDLTARDGTGALLGGTPEVTDG